LDRLRSLSYDQPGVLALVSLSYAYRAEFWSVRDRYVDIIRSGQAGFHGNLRFGDSDIDSFAQSVLFDRSGRFVHSGIGSKDWWTCINRRT
jgi:hypothetical protein